jgi:hypothetical protein
MSMSRPGDSPSLLRCTPHAQLTRPCRYLLALIHFNQRTFSRARECIDSATRILEREGISDEEQAARVQELAEEIEKHAPAGEAMDGDDDDGEEEEEGGGGEAMGEDDP